MRQPIEGRLGGGGVAGALTDIYRQLQLLLLLLLLHRVATEFVFLFLFFFFWCFVLYFLSVFGFRLFGFVFCISYILVAAG